MKDTADDIQEPVEDEDVVDEDLDDVEPTEAELADATVPPEPPVAEVESIQDLLVKQEARAEEEEEEEDEPLVTMAAEERVDALDTRVVPIQASEFTCKKCYLVKHRSQLKDKKRMLCRDCA